MFTKFTGTALLHLDCVQNTSLETAWMIYSSCTPTHYKMISIRRSSNWRGIERGAGARHPIEREVHPEWRLSPFWIRKWTSEVHYWTRIRVHLPWKLLNHFWQLRKAVINNTLRTLHRCFQELKKTIVKLCGGSNVDDVRPWLRCIPTHAQNRKC